MSEWISVEDRLPEDDDKDRFGRVLIYPSGNDSITTCCYYSERFHFPYAHFKATHWMPLPACPDANEFNVSRSAIKDVLNMKTWIPEAPENENE